MNIVPAAKTFFSLPPLTQLIGPPGATLAARLTQLIKTCFGLGQGLFLTGYGAKEVLYDGIRVRNIVKLDPNSKEAAIIEKIKKVRLEGAEHSILHGIFFAGTGMFGAISGANTMGLIHLGTALPFVDVASYVCFLVANLISLDQHLDLYQQVIELEQEASSKHVIAVIKSLKISAISGVVSTFNYIIATATFIFGGPIVAVIILGSIGLLAGCFKIAYDFFYTSSKLEKFS